MNERADRIAKRFEVPMLITAALVVPVLILQESDPEQPWKTIASVGNWAIWIAFAIESIVMLAVVPDRIRWIRENPFSLPIVLLTPPFAPPALQAGRVFRLLQLTRLGRAFRLIRRYFSLEGLKWVALLTIFVVIGGGFAFASVEKDQSSWDGIWWAVTTVTTVGYGDIYPKTDDGRAIAMVIMLAGIGFVAMLTAAMAQVFVERAVEEEIDQSDDEILRRLDEIVRRLDRLERQ